MDIAVPAADSIPKITKRDEREAPNDGGAIISKKQKKITSMVPGFAQNRQVNNNLYNNQHMRPPPFKQEYTLTPSASVTSLPEIPQEHNPYRHRGILLNIFNNHDPNYVPDFLTIHTPSDLDINITIDEQGNTALHWAATLARIPLMNVLINKGAAIQSKNNSGQTPLMRAVMHHKNHETMCFKFVLHALGRTLFIQDNNGRSILHHICLIQGPLKSEISRLYMEYVLEYAIQFNSVLEFVNMQDRNGDTALCISARIGNKSLVEQLVNVGANVDIRNNSSMRAADYGIHLGNVCADEVPVISSPAINQEVSSSFDGISLVRSTGLSRSCSLDILSEQAGTSEKRIQKRGSTGGRIAVHDSMDVEGEDFETIKAEFEAKINAMKSTIIEKLKEVPNGGIYN